MKEIQPQKRQDQLLAIVQKKKLTGWNSMQQKFYFNKFKWSLFLYFYILTFFLKMSFIVYA